eukprot:GFYU01000042.1.p1 GENE.GFYU01000042.1~~GFYU01000042.1.p1  ORF type:complete len:201 (+),score=24.92 GFYU01000042.1:89-691(+)
MATKRPSITYIQTLQQDWQRREFIDKIQINITKIVEFLNKFDSSTRYRLGVLNSKLTTLERQIDYVEAAVRSAGIEVKATAGRTVAAPSSTNDAVRLETISPGNGQSFPQIGHTVQIYYTGMLEDGTEFDSNRGAGTGSEFQLGSGAVIRGWEEALCKMSLGQRVKITVPPAFAYGVHGVPGSIPPNAVLIYDLELLAIR